MSSRKLLWLRDGNTSSFRPKPQLVHQYHVLNDFLMILIFGSFCENSKNTRFEQFDMLRLLECTNLDLGQPENVLYMCCMCLKLVLGS